MSDHVPPPLLAGRALTRSYGYNLALRQVNFDLDPAEIVAVLGENGAGKSTLLKIMAGVIQPDEGELRLAGQPQRFHSPRHALQTGIVAVPQELYSLPDLTVAENVCLGAWPRCRGLVSRRVMNDIAAGEFARLGVDIRPSARLAALRPSDRQLVEIAKALSRKARVLLLDEPTAALSAEECERLFGVLAMLARREVSVVYVSHRLNEVFRICSRVLVLRDGEGVFAARTRDATHDQVMAAMLGGTPEPEARRPVPPGVVRVPRRHPHPACGFRVESYGRRRLPRPLEFEVCPGEVLGLFGVRGAGCEDLANAIVGAKGAAAGAMTLDGATMPICRSPRKAVKVGIVHVPAERKAQGLVLGASLRSNLCLMSMSRVSRFGIVIPSAERALSRELAAVAGIRAHSLSQRAEELSGGNQQKALVASRLSTRPRLLVLQEPTRGIDVGARRELHERIRELAAEGVAVLVVTSDIEEATELSDRLLVMRDGGFAGELTGSQLTQARALGLASGAGGSGAGRG